MQIAILGAGAWGTALAVSATPRHPVRLYCRSAEQFKALSRDRENRQYLASVALPEGLVLTEDLGVALEGADLVVIATPVAGLRAMGRQLATRKVQSVVWLCKGMESPGGRLPHEVIAEEMPGASAAVLSGPSFALEVAQGLPTALTVASADARLLDCVVDAFHGGALRVYRSEDVIGVEIGGAVKNVMAIAAGISDGLLLGSNARAALITRGLFEIMRLALAMGAQAETVMGLTGVGDLILTCTGTLSRNRSVGLALGAGEPITLILERLHHVAEGVQSAPAVRELARARRVDMPITDAVCAVMFEQLAPRDALLRLLARAPRAER